VKEPKKVEGPMGMGMVDETDWRTFPSSRAIEAGPTGAGGAKQFWHKDITPQEEIDGWLACLGPSCRTASIVTPECIQDIQDGKCDDYRTHASTVTISHGPYLDDWSRVPPEVAAKYGVGPP